MARKPRAIVLDSWAIMSYLGGEPSAEKMANIMADAHEEDVPLFMSVVNVGEVWYILAREVSVAEADSSTRQLRQLGISFVDADWELAHEAAGFKSKHKMSFADCFAAALAKQKKAHLITGDQEFRQVEQDIIVTWLKN
ncbi:MAG TPA: type II toxin-antitoxin system VapC family toxin [Pyrinomonadaceae bacterium]|jgi:ribonuclease VapC|nr:type II toxin-antitoxin system VapC family toxin [Pyrinomonadaceae bacterium]